jgi:hypothetical protein
MVRLLARPEVGVFLGAVAVYVFFLIAAPPVRDASAMANILYQSSTLGIVTIPVALLMIGGEQTVQIARELVGQDKVVAIVNANGTSQAEAAFPFVLNQSKVPVLNEVGGTESWYQPPRPGLFGTQTLYEDQAAAIARLGGAGRREEDPRRAQ